MKIMHLGVKAWYFFAFDNVHTVHSSWSQGLWSWHNFLKMFKPGDHNFCILYVFLNKSWPKTKKSVGKFSFYTLLKCLPWNRWLLRIAIYIVQLCRPITPKRIKLRTSAWAQNQLHNPDPMPDWPWADGVAAQGPTPFGKQEKKKKKRK